MSRSKKIILVIVSVTIGYLLSTFTTSKKYASIVTGHPEATKIGEYILSIGGNAIAASISTQLALAVCVHRAGNIVGGGFHGSDGDIVVDNISNPKISNTPILLLVTPVIFIDLFIRATIHLKS